MPFILTRHWPTNRWLTNRWLGLLACLIGGILAAGVALHGLTEPHGLYGLSEYDDAVYLGAAFRFVHGQVPYKDFAFVQPPGITIILSPIAAIFGGANTREAMACARIATGCAVGINAFLAGWLVRHKGAVVALLVSVVLAIYPTAYFADHTVLLEPFVIFFCLLGANLAFRHGELATTRWLLFAGICFGIATSVKIWAIVPTLIALCCVAQRQWRKPAWFAAGACIGVGVICLPFFILAPHNFVHDIINAQVARSTVVSSHLTQRLWSLFGLRGFSVKIAYKSHLFVIDWIGVIVAIIAIGGGLLPLVLGRLSRLEIFALASGIVTFVMLMVPAQFYPHYAYFFAGFGVVTIGLCLARIVRALGTLVNGRLISGKGSSAPFRIAGTVVCVAVGVVAILGTVTTVRDETHYARSALGHVPQNFAIIEAAIPPGACVVSDAPALTLEADRFVSSDPHCPALVDADSTWLAYDNAQALGKLGSGDTRLVALWRQSFSEATWVVLSSPATKRIPWTPALRSYFDQHFTQLVIQGAVIFERSSGPPKLAKGHH